jgi:hypothetical protein
MAAAGDIYDEVIAKLKQHGATLVRHKKHQVWRLPDGRVLTLSTSPSDRKLAALNAMRDLRRLLGEQAEYHDGERRVRKPKKAARRSLGILAQPVPVRPKLNEATLSLLARPRPSLIAPPILCSPIYVERFPCTPLWAVLRRLLPFPSVSP